VVDCVAPRELASVSAPVLVAVDGADPAIPSLVL
jgi:hypothetical protein